MPSVCKIIGRGADFFLLTTFESMYGSPTNLLCGCPPATPVYLFETESHAVKASLELTT